MKCIIKSLLLSTFALFAVLFGSFIFTSKNVSAVSDLSITIPANSPVSYSDPVFSSCNDLSCLSQYSYLIVSSPSYPLSNNFNNFVQFRVRFYSNNYSSFTAFPFPGGSFFQIYRLPDFIVSNSSLEWANSQTFISDLTVTLSDHYQNCSCPICPEIPDNPYDPKFDEIKQAILIIPATALVIYFFFCIYRMLLKGRE